MQTWKIRTVPHRASTDIQRLDGFRPIRTSSFQNRSTLTAEAHQGMRSWLDVPVNSVLLGQLLSLAVTVTGTVSTSLAQHNASVPFTQSASNYALLFLVFGGPVRVCKWNWEQKAWKYGLLAAIDVVSTWCVVKAFSLTSITSVTLLDSWSIPCVIILTVIFFEQRYNTRQLLSAALAVSGLATLLLFDTGSSADPQSVTLLGDLLVIIGATGYGINNVLSEHILKTGEPAEFLAGLGTFGLAASCIAVPLFEHKELAAAPWTLGMMGLLALYATSMLMFSLGMPVVLHRSGSTFFNLSLLTSDFYAFAVRALFFHGFTRCSLTVYLISTTLVIIGLVLYFTSPSEPPPTGPQSTRPAQPLHTSVSSASHHSLGRDNRLMYAIPAVFPVSNAVETGLSPGSGLSTDAERIQTGGTQQHEAGGIMGKAHVRGMQGSSRRDPGSQDSQPSGAVCLEKDGASPCGSISDKVSPQSEVHVVLDPLHSSANVKGHDKIFTGEQQSSPAPERKSLGHDVSLGEPYGEVEDDVDDIDDGEQRELLLRHRE